MYTNNEGLWNRLVPSSEKKAYKGSKIVWMGAFFCFEEFSSVNWHINVGIASVFIYGSMSKMSSYVGTNPKS
jgi:hypothetical protein